MNTISLLFSLSFIMGIGFICGKVKFLDKTAYQAITKFIFYIATSALIIQAVRSIKTDTFSKFPRFIIANCVIVAVSYILIYLVLRLSKTSYRVGASILFTSNTANSIYLGLPLIKVLYGSEGLLYAVVFLAVPLTVADLVIFYLLSRWRLKASSLSSVLKDFAQNPIVLSTGFGLLLLITHVQLPQFISSGLDYLGITATGLALFATGLYLSIFLSKKFSLKTALIASFIKLLVVPSIAYSIARLLFGLSGIPLFVTVMIAAMPSAVFCLIVASQYQFDEKRTADAILLSTVLFLITSVIWTTILR